MAEDPLEFDCAFAKAVRNFAGTSYSQNIKNNLGPTDNLVYSPLSIVMALAALHVGAKAKTARQIEQVLDLSEEEAARLPIEIHKFLQSVEREEQQEDGTTKRTSPFRIANALALQENYAVESAFTQTLKESFGSDLSRVDFAKDTEAARRKINEWVANRTAQQIPELFSSGSISAMTRLVIANAVQFEAIWMNTFDEKKTRDATFSLLSSNSTVPVKMMTRKKTKFLHWTNTPNPDWPEAPTPYSDVVSLSILSLPYSPIGGEVIEMLIILPKERDGLCKLETLLSKEPKALDNLLDAMHKGALRRDVLVHLPSFKFAENLQLADILKQLGATDMFENGVADFGGISQRDAKALSVGAAVHRAVIDVDERGTRASAATGFAINLMCMPIPEEPIEFVVDHPSIFVLYSSALRIPLFVGRLAQPKRE